MVNVRWAYGQLIGNDQQGGWQTRVVREAGGAIITQRHLFGVGSGKSRKWVYVPLEGKKTKKKKGKRTN